MSMLTDKEIESIKTLINNTSINWIVDPAIKSIILNYQHALEKCLDAYNELKDITANTNQKVIDKQIEEKFYENIDYVIANEENCSCCPYMNPPDDELVCACSFDNEQCFMHPKLRKVKK